METKPNRLLAVAIVSDSYSRTGCRRVFLIARTCLRCIMPARRLRWLLLAVLLPLGWIVLSWAIAWVPMAGPTLGAAMFTIVMAGLVTALVLTIVGIANALNARMTPLFLVGRRGERLFVRLFPEPVVESKA